MPWDCRPDAARFTFLGQTSKRSSGGALASRLWDALLTGDARPVCPSCGAPLFSRNHGDQTCVQHGHFVSAQALDATFGANTAARVVHAVAASRLTPRKCPDDRYEMSQLGSTDACGRCGGVWVPLSEVERMMTAAPRSDLTMSEARSTAALGVVRALVAPATVQRAR